VAPKQAQKGQFEFSLPVRACGLVEVRRLKRELEMLDEFIRQSSLREPGKQAALPKTSHLLESLATENNLQLLQPEDRQRAADFLEAIERSAPRIYMSFAIESSGPFNAKVTEWLRANIDPHILLETGLQPTIAAGCMVRTPNKVFDFSLRHRFSEAQELLVQSLEQNAALASSAPVSAPAPAVEGQV
jgi:F0F1-type ATP synthase delta subunit